MIYKHPYMQVLFYLIKFSRASNRVKWLKVDKTDVSRTISVLVLSFLEDEDRDGPRNVCFIYF
jgi:hypothetical protein